MIAQFGESGPSATAQHDQAEGSQDASQLGWTRQPFDRLGSCIKVGGCVDRFINLTYDRYHTAQDVPILRSYLRLLVACSGQLELSEIDILAAVSERSPIPRSTTMDNYGAVKGSVRRISI